MAAAFTRRKNVVACLLAGLAAGGIAASATPAAAAGRAASAAAATAAAPPPALPGPYQVGTFATGLVDGSRLDPFTPKRQDRAAMIQLWYPAFQAEMHPLAPYMPTGAAAYEDRQGGLPSGTGSRSPLPAGRA